VTGAEAALARLRSAAEPRDGYPDEDVTVRVGDVWALLAELERLREALSIIAGEQACADNLLGNADIARIALRRTETS
jgi:hypothetical protein